MREALLDVRVVLLRALATAAEAVGIGAGRPVAHLVEATVTRAAAVRATERNDDAPLDPLGARDVQLRGNEGLGWLASGSSLQGACWRI